MNKELQEKIEEYCRSNWAKAPNQTLIDAIYIQDVAIAAMNQLLSSPDLLRLAGYVPVSEVREAVCKGYDIRSFGHHLSELQTYLDTHYPTDK